MRGAFIRLLSRFIPFALLIERMIDRFNRVHGSTYSFRDEGHLPASLDVSFPRRIEFFSSDRKRVRFGVVLRDPEGGEGDDDIERYLKHQLEKIYSFRSLRLMNDLDGRLNPVARKSIVAVLIWGAEPTPLERLLLRIGSSVTEGELDRAREEIASVLDKKSWRAWRDFRVRIVGEEPRGVYLKVGFGEEVRLVVAGCENGDELLPQFFERIEAGVDIVQEHAKLIKRQTVGSLRSLSLRMKKSGDYRFVTRGIAAAHYHSERARWLPLPEIGDSGIGRGVMKRGDRLFVFATTTESDELRERKLFESIEEFFSSGTPAYAAGRAVLLKRL